MQTGAPYRAPFSFPNARGVISGPHPKMYGFGWTIMCCVFPLALNILQEGFIWGTQ
jgi:hypothetical protein